MEKNGEMNFKYSSEGEKKATVPKTLRNSSLSNDISALSNIDEVKPNVSVTSPKKPQRPVLQPIDKRSNEMKKMEQLEKQVKEANDVIKKHVPKIGGKSSLPSKSKHAPNFKLPVPDLQPI